MAFAEDFSTFFDMDGFGITFTYTPKVGAEITAVGIFDNAFFQAEGGEVGVAGSQPRITFESARIPSATYGETITIDEKSYTIVAVHPDGTGTTTLALEDQE